MSKTIKVETIRKWANAYLSNEPNLPDSYVTAESQRGVAELLETILHDTGNYHGFGYVDGWKGVETYRRFYY